MVANNANDNSTQESRINMSWINNINHAQRDDERSHAMDGAVYDSDLDSLRDYFLSEWLRSHGEAFSGPSVQTFYDGSVKVLSRRGHPLVQVTPDQTVTVTTPLSSLIVQPDGDFDALVRPGELVNVAIRIGRDGASGYTFKDDAHELKTQTGLIRASEDGAVAVESDWGRSVFAVQANGDFKSNTGGISSYCGIVVHGQYGVRFDERAEPLTFRLDSVPRLGIGMADPYWLDKSYGPFAVLRQPLKEPSLQLGDLVEVLVQSVGAVVSSEVVQIGPELSVHAGDRRFYLDKVDIAPDADGVLRLGQLRGKIGHTSISRPVAEPTDEWTDDADLLLDDDSGDGDGGDQWVTFDDDIEEEDGDANDSHASRHDTTALEVDRP